MGAEEYDWSVENNSSSGCISLLFSFLFMGFQQSKSKTGRKKGTVFHPDFYRFALVGAPGVGKTVKFDIFCAVLRVL